MKVAVVNYCGTVGKTTIASELLVPRMEGAQLFAIETVNETAAELGLTIEQLRGRQFGELFKELMMVEAAIVDVGASNAEEFLNRMGSYAGSHAEIDCFIVPVTSGVKEQSETIKTVRTLTSVGVPRERIRVLFNRVADSVEEEFVAVLGFAATSGACIATVDAAIHENEVFHLLARKRTTINAVLADPTDYRELVRSLSKARDRTHMQHAADMHAIRSLARGVKDQLDEVYAALFRAVA
jgi:hypothetical protein